MPTSETRLAVQPSHDAEPDDAAVMQHQRNADEAEPEPEPIAAASRVSPMKRLAMVDVRIGCKPGISAEMPAGTPWLMATNTPPR